LDAKVVTKVVLTPALGAEPFDPANAAVFAPLARYNKYPFVVAPELGKVALVQLKSMLLVEVAVELKALA
jgi:hypothetical protein